MFGIRLLLLAASLVAVPIRASPIPPPVGAGLEDRSPTSISGHGVLVGDGTVSGAGGEVLTPSTGGLQSADATVGTESIIVNGKPLDFTGGDLTVIDGQDGSSIGGVKKNPDGSTSVDISGTDITRGGVTIVS